MLNLRSSLCLYVFNYKAFTVWQLPQLWYFTDYVLNLISMAGLVSFCPICSNVSVESLGKSDAFNIFHRSIIFSFVNDKKLCIRPLYVLVSDRDLNVIIVLDDTSALDDCSSIITSPPPFSQGDMETPNFNRQFDFIKMFV